MNNIIIQGAGFTDNFGDVLFYDIFIKESNKYNINVDILKTDEKVLQHLNIKVNKENVIRKLIKADGIVFVGGGYMGEQPYKEKFKLYKWGFSAIKNILYVGILGVLFRKKIIVIGVGAGPVTNPITRYIIKKICNYSEKTIVRDKESYEFLKSIMVKEEKLDITADTVLALHKYYNLKKINRNNKTITLHLSDSYKNNEKINFIVKDVEKYLEKYPEYRLKAITDHNGGGQDIAIKDLKEKFQDKINICKYESPNQLINELNISDVVITNKLHVGIVSSTLGKSVFSIANHPKTKRFFTQIGYGNRCIISSELKEGDLFNLMDSYNNQKIKINKDTIDKAYKNIEYFRKFINM
ncbi:polysaccharide pyruvyl transferase family protein [Clostridium isatidis]|uniref:polysaccharide pyruvyl transferase family protein n=1 Tax=Clostridium isatidis TaxID=182773 RepID=UPI003AAF8483